MERTTLQLYQPHENQIKIHQKIREVRYVVVDAGRRFGKTALALNESLARILQLENQLVWIVLPEYKQAYDIYWGDPDVNKYWLPYVQSGIIEKNEVRYSLTCPATNSRLVLKGSDNYESLRGSGLDLIIFDETRNIKPMAFDVISGTLIDSPNHKVVYISTPNGYDKFHDFCLLGDHENIIEKAGKTIKPDPDYYTFKFTSFDNKAFVDDPHRQAEFEANLERERRKYEQMGQLDFYEQEYLAEFRKKAGSVHKMFNRANHLIPEFAVPIEWRRTRGIDFGSTHPTASIRIAIDNDENWFVEYCYKERDKQMDDHAASLKTQDEDLGGSVPMVGDPSGAQWIRELNSRGLSIRAAKKDPKTKDKSWVQLAIDVINAKMQPREGHTVYLPNGRKIENAPSFFILNRPENIALVDEVESLVYKKTSAGILQAEIDDTQDAAGHYDIHAALRYLAVSINSGFAVSYTPVAAPPDPRAITPQPVRMEEDERKRLEHEADMELIRRQNGTRW